MKSYVVLLLLLVSFAGAVPNYNDVYVNDFSGVLSIEESSHLRELFYSVDLESSAEVVFVSVDECSSFGGPSEYAVEIFNSWGVGKRDKDNGLLILYCKGENKIWVTVGYGLEGILPDSKIGRLLDENYVLHRDEGEVSRGIILFSEEISNILVENAEEILSGESSGYREYNFLLELVGIIILIAAFSMLFRLASRNKNNGELFWFIYLILSPFFGNRSGGGFGGGFGGGGRGGFGGGRSGGGGAGR